MNEVGRGCERCFRGLGIVGSWVPLGPFLEEAEIFPEQLVG